MDATYFYPPHRLGLIFHLSLILLLVAAGTWSLWQASDAQMGPLFLLYLVPACLALIGVPLLGYRAYALWRAAYLVGRSGIALRWGLREEDIPVDVIEWVRPEEDLEVPFSLPLIRLPGAVLGVRGLPGGAQVEYLAARSRDLVYIRTGEKYFAVSPSDPAKFLDSCQRLTEFAKLAPLPARSAYPSFLINRVWAVRPARALLLSGLILAAVLLVSVSLVIPSRELVSLGFSPDGFPTAGVPAVQLLLLPVLNGFFFFAEALLGLFFFRREAENSMAYLLWASGVVSGVLFLAALYFILRVG